MRISDWSSDVCSSDLVKAPITLDLHVEGRSVPPTPLADLVAAGKAALKEAEAAKSAAKKTDDEKTDDESDKKDDDKDVTALKPQAMFLSSGESTALTLDVDRKSTRLNSSH